MENLTTYTVNIFNSDGQCVDIIEDLKVPLAWLLDGRMVAQWAAQLNLDPTLVGIEF